MIEDQSHLLTEATRLAMLQARGEAVRLGAPMVGPEHLALAMLKALPVTLRETLLPGRSMLPLFCAEFGAPLDPAPLALEDIDYAPAAHAAMAGAIHLAGNAVEPLHVLLGLHEPKGPDGAAAPSPVSAKLSAIGLDAARMRVVLAER